MSHELGNISDVTGWCLVALVFAGGILFICVNAFSDHKPDRKGDDHD